MPTNSAPDPTVADPPEQPDGPVPQPDLPVERDPAVADGGPPPGQVAAVTPDPVGPTRPVVPELPDDVPQSENIEDPGRRDPDARGEDETAPVDDAMTDAPEAPTEPPD